MRRSSHAERRGKELEASRSASVASLRRARSSHVLVSVVSLLLLTSLIDCRGSITTVHALISKNVRRRSGHCRRPVSDRSLSNDLSKQNSREHTNLGRNNRQERVSSLKFAVGAQSWSETVLPPWLSRYERMTTLELEHEIAWQKYILFENGFTSSDVQEIMQTIYSEADGEIAVAAGMIDFSRTVMKTLSEDEPGASSWVELDNSRVLLSKEILLASVFHFKDCIAFRKGETNCVLGFLDPSASDQFDEGPIVLAKNDRSMSSAIVISTPTQTAYVEEARSIADAAARIKRAELLSTAVLDPTKLKPDGAAKLRGLYLSVADDWRALALRCIACLYRLEGILPQTDSGTAEYLARTPGSLHTAREALRVYAVLAQRLGMQRLKSKIEERAFRILYRRQYEAVSSLYRESGPAMHAVSSFLLSYITKTLRQDEALMAQLQDLKVSTRVKEPFSFWKKMIQKKVGYLSRAKDSSSTESGKSLNEPSSLSVTKINDAVAVRVVLEACKHSEDEEDEITRARERLLCYYVQQRLQALWPTDEDRVKDYIAFPKPNGYQSLHHTSSFIAAGLDFPFEVQVRSSEMHDNAEFGLASHWFYKLGNQNQNAPVFVPAPINKDLPLLPPTLPPAQPGKIARAKRSVAITTRSNQYRGSTTTYLDALVDEGTEVMEQRDYRMIRRKQSVAITSKSNQYRGLTTSYLDALVSARQELIDQQVYVFLTTKASKLDEGQLISLPSTCRVKDALTAVDLPLNDTAEVWKNGKLAEQDDSLENGDILFISV